MSEYLSTADYESEFQNLIMNMMIDSSNKYLFYGLFLSEVNWGFVEDDHPIQTACIGKFNGDGFAPKMFFNKKFWREACKDKSQKLFLILHELNHMIHEHISSYSSKLYPDKNIANYAFDIFINQDISEKSPTGEDGKPSAMMPSTFPNLNLKPNESSLYYYRALCEARDKKEQSAGSQDSLAGLPGNKQGSSGDKNFDAMMDSNQDIHASWDELTEGMSDMEKELLKNELRSQLERIAEETEKSRGTVPASLANSLKNAIQKEAPVVSWKDILRRFIGSAISNESYDTRKRPNFRFEDAPSHRMKTKIKTCVLCDSSGSMSDYDMNEINSEMFHLWKTGSKVDFATWDAECEDAKPYDGKLTFERTKCGGTRIGCAIEYINDNYKKHNWSFAVIGTDGYTESDPPICKIPLIIIITKNGTMDTIKTPHKMVKIN